MSTSRDAVTIAAIVALGVCVLAAVISLAVVAIFTDRDLAYAEGLTAGGVLVIAALGGLIVRRYGVQRRNGDDS